MKPRIYIFVNGIMNWPGSSHSWNERAVTWVHLGRYGSAEKVEYFCTPIGRAIGQDRRAEKLVNLLAAYSGWEIHLVGHSNGAAVILDALRLSDWPRVESLHLVSGACESSFDRNGLNQALLFASIGRVCVYVGGKDLAMRYARTWFARLLGYGTLGLHGPEQISPHVKDRVGLLTWPDFGHSDCFHPNHFNQTMRHFVLPCAQNH